MKRKLLIIMCVFATNFVAAQCVPDMQFTAPGIYPDEATGIDDAIVGQPYNQVITIITPLDTNVEYNGIPIPVTIQSIELLVLLDCLKILLMIVWLLIVFLMEDLHLVQYCILLQIHLVQILVHIS